MSEGKKRTASTHGAAAIALSLVTVLAVTGCSASRAMRRMSPYPAQGQSEAQRQQDMAECEAWATHEGEAVADGDGVAKSALGGALVGGAIGAAAGAATFAAAGRGSGPAAAVGATLGAISGALSGGVGRAVTDQKVVLAGWRNCMIARGYVVDGGAAGPVAVNDLGTLGGATGGISSLW